MPYIVPKTGTNTYKGADPHVKLLARRESPLAGPNISDGGSGVVWIDSFLVTDTGLEVLSTLPRTITTV